MELKRRPFMDPFWNRPLCDECRREPKYALITALTAKKSYFLNEDDLVALRTISKENTHRENAGHIRYFSREAVRRMSVDKLGRGRKSREQRVAEQRRRRERAGEAWVRMMEGRRIKIAKVLRENGFAGSHNCLAIRGFVRNGWMVQVVGQNEMDSGSSSQVLPWSFGGECVD